MHLSALHAAAQTVWSSIFATKMHPERDGIVFCAFPARVQVSCVPCASCYPGPVCVWLTE
jgi:hypothetical protein